MHMCCQLGTYLGEIIPSAQGFRRDLDVAHASCVYEVIMFNVYKKTVQLNLCPVYKDISVEMIQILTKTVQS